MCGLVCVGCAWWGGVALPRLFFHFCDARECNLAPDLVSASFWSALCVAGADTYSTVHCTVPALEGVESEPRQLRSWTSILRHNAFIPVASMKRDLAACNASNAEDDNKEPERKSDIAHEQESAIGRHPTLGVPVGCLRVPRAQMATVKNTLQMEGKRNNNQWLRYNGTVPIDASNHQMHAYGGNDSTAFDVHVTVFAAIRFEENRSDVPAAVRDLLESGAIQWIPGVRCNRITHHPKIIQLLQDLGAAGTPSSAAEALPPSQRKAAAFSPQTDSQIAASHLAEAAGASDAPPPAFRFAELFAGIGGFRIGLEALGGECAFSSELDPHAAATYAINFGRPPTAGDITEVSNEALPAHDILVGGFPCQSFSTAGEQEGLGDHRGQLYLEVCRVLGAARPRAFLLENVAGLFTLDGGGFHKEYSKRTPGKAHLTIVAAFEACGYSVSSRILPAHSFGVPQYRDRLYFVGFADSAAAQRFKWPASASEGGGDVVYSSQANDGTQPMAADAPAAGALPAGTRPTVRSVLEPAGSTAVEAAALSRAQYARIREFMQPGRGCRAARLDNAARTLMASYRSGWLRHSEFVPMGGSVAASGAGEGSGSAGRGGRGGGCGQGQASEHGGGSSGEAETEEGARFYTAREAARIMGFPESFIIPGHPTHEHGPKAHDAYARSYHQIGNAVCPPVVQAVAEPMLKALGVVVQPRAVGTGAVAAKDRIAKGRVSSD